MFHSVSLPGRGELERPVSCGGGARSVCVRGSKPRAGPAPRQSVAGAAAGAAGCAFAGSAPSAAPGPGRGSRPVRAAPVPRHSVGSPSPLRPRPLAPLRRGARMGIRGGRPRLPGLPPTGTRGGRRAPAPSAPPAEPGLPPRRRARPRARSSRAVRGWGCPRAGRCRAPRASGAREGHLHGQSARCPGKPLFPGCRGVRPSSGGCSWGAVWGRLLSMGAMPLLLFYPHPATWGGQG